MTELQLAQKIAKGDGEAAEAFVREHYPAVLRFSFRLCGRKEEAEDIAQDTFVAARQKIGSFKGRSSLRTWIHTIALNEYRQWRRRQRPLGLLDHDGAAADLAIAQFETGHVLAEALKRLPEKQREAFVLFEVEQLSMNEVAMILDVPLGTAKARAHYARQSLREILSHGISVKNDELRESISNG